MKIKLFVYVFFYRFIKFLKNLDLIKFYFCFFFFINFLDIFYLEMFMGLKLIKQKHASCYIYLLIKYFMYHINKINIFIVP